jgi:spore coat protein CotH
MKYKHVALILASFFVTASIIAGTKEKVQKSAPDYETVFPQNKVNRIDIMIKPSDWDKMQVALDSAFGKMKMGMPGGMPPMMDEGDSMQVPGEGGFPPMPPMGDNDSGFMAPPPGMPGQPGSPMGEFGGPGRPGGSGGGPGSNYDPQYLCCSVLFNGKQLMGVGFRLKGNSSLMAGYSANNQKMPFRLDFDKYSDSLPDTKNQTFYGFEKLSFSNNTKDMSFLREKLANDLFRQAGVNSAQTAFYQVYIDYGQGAVYFGLYTAVEIVEDKMLKTQFGNGSGNCYKPDGNGASFAANTFNTESFEKKNNKKKADWSDVKALNNCLNSNLRTTDPAKWRTQLESIFDVPSFLNYLAVNNTILNWDTYGNMTHNYYLYHNPQSDKLVWIPWDNNEALSGGGMRGGSSLAQSDISNRWPLIRYLLDQPEYMAIYHEKLLAFTNNVFNYPRMKQEIEKNIALIYPYVIGKEGEVKGHSFLRNEKDFTNAQIQLLKHVEQRNKAVKEYLQKNK